MGTYITFPELFILLPLIAGILCFFFKKGDVAKNLALFISIITFAIVLISLCYTDQKYVSYNAVSYVWLKYLGSSYFVGLDSLGRVLCLLTSLGIAIIFAATYNRNYSNGNNFFGLMLLAQAGITGVFCAFDALTFYFFWELALIPVYFLCSKWGGPNSIKSTYKFFVYTFLGSLLMLIGIIYVYLHTPNHIFANGTSVKHSFSLISFKSAVIDVRSQNLLFWLFFAAFAIKMPVFPFHTWQPDTYDQSPTPVTMLLSGIMVKMGLLGVIRWLIPVLSVASVKYANIVMILSIAGIIYASCIAIVQDNLKKLVAYSSIAHIGLMCAAIFAMNSMSVHGAILQMFNHGINIIALWIVIDLIETKTGVKTISGLSGIANKAPFLTIALVVIAFANIALPLTNAFVGEFMMFAGIWKHKPLFAVFAVLAVILAAVYTLNMIQKVFYGTSNSVTIGITDVSFSEKVILTSLILAIFIIGIFPQPLIDLSKDAVSDLLNIQTLK